MKITKCKNIFLKKSLFVQIQRTNITVVQKKKKCLCGTGLLLKCGGKSKTCHGVLSVKGKNPVKIFILQIKKLKL